MMSHATNATPAHSQRQNVRPADVSDLDLVVDLQRKFSDHLGFIPRTAVESLLLARSALITTQNGQPAGAILYKPTLRHDPRALPILQAAVYRDAARRHHGLSMIEQLAMIARQEGRSMLQCWAAADLPDLDFWTAAGFERIVTREGGSRRGRDLILYRRPLTPTADIYRILPDPRSRGPGGRFVPPPPKIDQPTLWDLSTLPTIHR